MTYSSVLGKYNAARESFVSLFVKDKIVIDVGCGYGNIAHHLKSWGAEEVIGVDTSVERTDFANKNYQDTNLTFLLMDACKLAFRDESFDVVYSLATIEHISNPSQFLEECHRVLKTGGIFICSAVNKYRSLLSKSKHARQEHLREYSPKELGELIKHFFPYSSLYYQGKLGKDRYAVRLLSGMPELLVYHILAVSKK